MNVHETVIIDAPPFMFPRCADGSREPWTADLHGSQIHDDVDIFAFAIIASGTQGPTTIEPGARIAYRAQIGHDARIGEDTIIGAGAIICGFVSIGKRCTIGAGAIVTPLVHIADDCFVGAGCVVTHHLCPNTKVTTSGTRKNWENKPWNG